MKRGPYKNRINLFKEAIKLRKQGYGYRTIEHRLNGQVSWRTIANWSVGIKVDKRVAHMIATKYFDARCKELEDCQTNAARRRCLIRERAHRCESCKRKKWLGKNIPLEIDHINGVRADNAKKNLRLLCPNCHALTETYKGKNIKYKEGVKSAN